MVIWCGAERKKALGRACDVRRVRVKGSGVFGLMPGIVCTADVEECVWVRS